MMKPKKSTCDLESECQIVTTKEGLRALKIVTQFCDTHGSDDELQFNLLSVEEGM
jgi:hypothetical protein